MLHTLFRIRFRLACPMLIILSMLSFSTLSAATSLQQGKSSVQCFVATGNDQGYTIKVLALRAGNTTMIDLESMARALRLSFRQDQGVLVLEDSRGIPGSLCTLINGNNFVRIVSRDTELPKRVIQLQSPPSLIQSRLYLPVTQACRLYAVWLDRDIVYSSSSGRISVGLRGKPAGASAVTIGVVRNDEHRVSAPGIQSAEASATVITGVEVENRANGAIISFLASGVPAEAALLKPDSEGNAYFSLEKASCDVNALSRIYRDGLVREITPRQFAGGGVQFTVTLDNRAFVINSVEFQRDAKNNRYVLYVRSNADVQEIRRKEKEEKIAQVISRDVEKWKLNTIVLDAGHGGKDPGAIGGNGTNEKDVVLNIVHDLGTFIEQRWPDVHVIYTRKDDSFIPLYERGKIANRNGGKLFVSLHCNASPNKSAHGSEVYILGLHKTRQALDVAMFENSVIRKEEDYQQQYKGFSEEHLIMSTMAQNAFAKQSTTLAQDILRPVERKPGSNSRTVRQAGFMVLWTPSMPSALVEVGYLSNPEEEKILRDRQAQTKIAWGIFQGLQVYRKNYETSSMSAMGQ
ncbi:MAG: N-acetylmuramoyl-L-alanine amidase [Chlorobium sp.]|nr:MAG: N-acetylmuramoyl-L-alanine amidase [Chlorobium sp.]